MDSIVVAAAAVAFAFSVPSWFRSCSARFVVTSAFISAAGFDMIRGHIIRLTGAQQAAIALSSKANEPTIRPGYGVNW